MHFKAIKCMQNILNTINERNLWDKTLVLKRNEYLKKSGSKDTNIYFVDQNKLYVSSGRSQWIAQYDNNEIIKTEFNSVDDTMYIYTYHKDKDNIICYEKNNEFYFPNN